MCDFHQCKGSNSSLPKPIQGVQSPFLVAKHLEKRSSTASWRLQPIWNIFVKNGVILKIHSGWTFQKTFETTTLHFWQRICWKLENGQVGRCWFTCLGTFFPDAMNVQFHPFLFWQQNSGHESYQPKQPISKKPRKSLTHAFASSFIPPDMGKFMIPAVPDKAWSKWTWALDLVHACCLLWYFSHFTSSLVFFSTENEQMSPNRGTV